MRAGATTLAVMNAPVDKFLLQCLQQGNPVLSHFIAQSEASIRTFCSNKSQYELAFPPLNSFHRRCLHCLARLYGLSRQVEETNLFNAESTVRSMSLLKPENYSVKAIPLLKCADFIPVDDISVEAIISEAITSDDASVREAEVVQASTVESNTTDTAVPRDTTQPDPVQPQSNNAQPKIKILKRTASSDSASGATTLTASPSTPATAPIQEREVLYQAARERIFKDFPSSSPSTTASKLNPNAQSFSLPPPSQTSVEPLTFAHIFTFRAKNSLSRAQMHEFCQEAKTSARLFEFPVQEGFLLGKEGGVLDGAVLEKWQIEISPFSTTQIYE